YFAPELGNVFKRRGMENEAAFKAYFSAWMKAMPTGVEGRGQMPQYNLSDQEVNDIAEFRIGSARIDTNRWPSNKGGRVRLTRPRTQRHGRIPDLVGAYRHQRLAAEQGRLSSPDPTLTA